jgi:hypothetical protein
MGVMMKKRFASTMTTLKRALEERANRPTADSASA